MPVTIQYDWKSIFNLNVWGYMEMSLAQVHNLVIQVNVLELKLVSSVVS